MSEQAEQQQETTTAAAPERDREVSRMKRALKSQQEEKATLATELADLRKQIENDKLSAADRERKELNEARAQVAEAQALLAQQKTANARLQRVNTLVSKHKLADEEYADVILNKYKPEEHDDFDAFVTQLAADAKYKVFFAQPAVAKADPVAPAIGGSGSGKETKPRVSVEDEIQAQARDLFPTDTSRREAFVRNLKNIKGIV